MDSKIKNEFLLKWEKFFGKAELPFVFSILLNSREQPLWQMRAKDEVASSANWQG